MSRKKVEDNEDLLVVKPLGAGQEVGRSCILLEFKGKKVMVQHFEFKFKKSFYLLHFCFKLDFGIHPGLNGTNALPFIDQVDIGSIDILLISQ